MQTEHAPELCCGTSPDLRFAQVRDQWCFGCCRSAKPSCKVWWVLYTRFFISSLWTICAIARFSERLLPDTKMHVLARDNQLNWVLCSCVWEIALTSSTSASYRFYRSSLVSRWSSVEAAQSADRVHYGLFVYMKCHDSMISILAQGVTKFFSWSCSLFN